eukprot:14289849-Ditylum_brightwellii.AAC.1
MLELMKLFWLVMKFQSIDIVASTTGNLIGVVLVASCVGKDCQKMVTSVSAMTFNFASRGRR